jgi:hypothetical protein
MGEDIEEDDEEMDEMDFTDLDLFESFGEEVKAI